MTNGRGAYGFVLHGTVPERERGSVPAKAGRDKASDDPLFSPLQSWIVTYELGFGATTVLALIK